MGLIMAASTYQHFAVTYSFIAEAKACEIAISFAIELGFRKIQVEGDSLSAIKKILSEVADKSILSPIVCDIKSKKEKEIIPINPNTG
ncbi:hypothetical protein V6N12_003126 [Hibiscus sabdariffa]|uniref:RNase H type-1 domain-containing protein n=1 Tax=Hibiscus sabdariffa TaxID=183260 RepID=A0ABR2EB00_9ROSI